MSAKPQSHIGPNISKERHEEIFGKKETIEEEKDHFEKIDVNKELHEGN